MADPVSTVSSLYNVRKWQCFVHLSDLDNTYSHTEIYEVEHSAIVLFLFFYSTSKFEIDPDYY